MRGVLVCEVIEKSRAALASICWMQGRMGVSRAGDATEHFGLGLVQVAATKRWL